MGEFCNHDCKGEIFKKHKWSAKIYKTSEQIIHAFNALDVCRKEIVGINIIGASFFRHVRFDQSPVVKSSDYIVVPIILLIGTFRLVGQAGNWQTKTLRVFVCQFLFFHRRCASLSVRIVCYVADIPLRSIPCMQDL
jgi:hypothetical protein